MGCHPGVVFSVPPPLPILQRVLYFAEVGVGVAHKTPQILVLLSPIARTIVLFVKMVSSVNVYGAALY